MACLHVYKLTAFIYSLFNDYSSVTQTMYRRTEGLQVNDELERIWKEAVVA
jgi:hypothetical protein